MNNRKLDNKDKPMVHIRLPSELKSKLDAVSKKTGLSVNVIVLNCITEKYENLLNKE